MKIGDKINTSLGNVLVLDIKEGYLILFDLLENRFVKANEWEQDYLEATWNNAEYYKRLDEVINAINKDGNK